MAKKEKGERQQVGFNCTEEDRAKLEELADQLFDGNISLTIRKLIRDSYDSLIQQKRVNSDA